MSKVIWRANRVISIETRRKDENRKENVYVLAQMINNAQLLVFNLFSTDNRWENIDLNEVYAGLQIQLLTYLDAACKEEDLLPAGILYFNLIEQMVKTEKNIGIEIIEEQIRKGVKMKGLILADVKVVKLHDKNLEKGASALVPAYIDKEGGITVDDCEVVARQMNEILDREDYIPDSYTFEVSSPGLGRPLKKEKDYVRNMNKDIEIRTYRAINKSKEFYGLLKAYDKETVTITDEDGNETTINKSDIALIRQALDF